MGIPTDIVEMNKMFIYLYNVADVARQGCELHAV